MASSGFLADVEAGVRLAREMSSGGHKVERQPWSERGSELRGACKPRLMPVSPHQRPARAPPAVMDLAGASHNPLSPDRGSSGRANVRGPAQSRVTPPPLRLWAKRSSHAVRGYLPQLRLLLDHLPGPDAREKAIPLSSTLDVAWRQGRNWCLPTEGMTGRGIRRSQRFHQPKTPWYLGMLMLPSASPGYCGARLCWDHADRLGDDQ